MQLQNFTIDDLQQIRKNFRRRMESNIEKGRDIPLFFNDIPQRKQKLLLEQKAHIFVIGGTKFASASVNIRDFPNMKFENIELDKVSNFQRIKDLLKFIKNFIQPDTDLIGINLAIALLGEIRDGYLDGRINKGTKHNLEGLEGGLIGEFIEKELHKQFGRKIRVSVANDTVCLGLAAKNELDNVSLTGVVGTGFNLAVVEERRIINLEAGGFRNFQQSEDLLYVDENSISKGRSLFEKMISGKYLYQHYNFLKGREVIQTSEELNNLANEGDEFAVAIIDRSAKLVASSIAGVMDYYKLGNLTTAFEGSVFWNSSNYSQSVLKQMEVFGFNSSNINFMNIQNSSLKGALALIL